MARTLSSNILTQIQAEGVRIVHLLKLDTSTAIKATNHVKDLSYDSNTYEAGGNFMDISEVQETGSLEYSNLNVSLNNVTTTVRDIFKAQNYIDKTATVYIAFLNSDETILDAYEYFKGTIASANLAESNQGFVINLELASQFKNWEIKKGRKFTQASQDAYTDRNSLSADKGLAFAHETNESVRWNR
jgi:hypothetical protein